MTDNCNKYDPTCVLKVDAGYVSTILAESGEETPDPKVTAAICDELGERWVARGLYDEISNDIIESAAEVARRTEN